MSETPNIQVQEADPMPEPTPTYTLEDFQKAIVRELRILERWCPDPTCPEAADIRDTIRLLTFAQGLAQQIPMLKQLLAESRERNESLTRALAAKTQELARAREYKADELHLCAGFQNRIAELERLLDEVSGAVETESERIVEDVSARLHRFGGDPNDGDVDSGDPADYIAAEAIAVIVRWQERAEVAEHHLATVKAAIEAEKRLGHTLSLGPLYGERTPAPVIRLAPIEAALLGDGPGPALAPQADLQADLHAFAAKLAAAQRDLPADAAKLLRDNLWKLYDEMPEPAAGGAASPPNTECYPTPCQCCECNGKHCLVSHPGHSHRYEELLDQAMRNKGRPKDVEAWAKKLAEDSVKAGEIEAGGAASPAPQVTTTKRSDEHE